MCLLKCGCCFAATSAGLANTINNRAAAIIFLMIKIYHAKQRANFALYQVRNRRDPGASLFKA